MDKPFFRILNLIADWIIRIIVLNVFVIVLTLPIVTFYAGYKAAYSLFVDYTEDKTTPLFRGFWENLKKNFWNNIGVGSIFLVLIVLGFLGAYNYNNMIAENPDDIFYLVGFVITLGVSLLLIMAMLNSITVSYINEDISVKDLFKISLVLTGKYLLRSIVVILVSIAAALLLLEPMLMPIFVFAGLTVPIIVNVLLMRKPRRFLRGE